MQKSIYLLIVSCILLAFSSCRKDSYTETFTTNPPIVIDVNFVEAKVQGVVVDQNNNAVSDAFVRWGENTVNTDENGVFIIAGTVKQKQARLDISKEGYFIARQVLQTYEKENTTTKVKLIQRELTEAIASQETTTIQTNGGAEITFAQDGFENEDGSSYSGEVNVYAYYLDPSRDDLQEIMPGNLLAQNADRQLQVLQSFAMLNVELEDPQGRPLQLSKPAKLSFPVPSSLSTNAPTNIPLWYYDLEADLWKEEGEALLEENKYVGEVAHFTWWNCDIPAEVIFLEGTINPIRGSYWDHVVRLTVVSTGASAIATVSQQGSFSGFVPKGEVFLLEILNTCNDPVFTTNIGAFEEDTVLPAITVSTPPENWFLISGKLLDCQNTPVTNGYVSVNYANQNRIIFVNDEGNFAEVFPECIDKDVAIVGVDLDNLKSSPVFFATLDMDINVELLNACDELAGQFSLSLQGDSIVGRPCTMNIVNISSTKERYDISLVHPQENGTVIYLLYITSFIDTPLSWTSIAFQSNQTIIQGNPEIIFDFEDRRAHV